MSKRLPQHALEFFADTTGLQIGYTAKEGIRGSGKVRVPMSDNMRLVCPTTIVGSRYFDKDDKAAIVMHVRHDLYLLIVYDTTNRSAGMFAVDGGELQQPDKILQRQALPKIMKQTRRAIVRSWVMQRGGTWAHVSADRLG